jgi:drug/metabolite transporter (DMT)-like permease
MNKKWIGIIILAIVGIIAAIVAVEYLTLPIHSLPSFLGGKHPVHGKHYRGNHHKRGDLAAVVAVIAFGGAIYLGIRVRAEGIKASTPPAPSGAEAEESPGTTGSVSSDLL